MGWGVEITNAEEGTREEMLLLSNGNYVLPSGATLSLSEQPAWCQRCRKFVRAEYLSSLEEIDAEVTKYQEKVADSRKLLAGLPKSTKSKDRQHVLHELSIWEDAIVNLANRRQWRISRQSPPKCLECRSTELDLPPSGVDEYPHPGGKGRVRVEIISHVSLFLDEKEYYSPEGVRIEGPRASTSSRGSR